MNDLCEYEGLRTSVLSMTPALKDELLSMLLEFKRVRTVSENFLKLRLPQQDIPSEDEVIPYQVECTPPRRRSSLPELHTYHAHLKEEGKLHNENDTENLTDPSGKLKLIFLDVDGVLHSMTGYKTFTTKCMKHLETICTRSNARIVLSSTWRCSPKTTEMVNKKLIEYGLTTIYGCTPLEGEEFRRRSEEIFEYLEEHVELGKESISHWIAIDDMDLSVDKRMANHFVLTNGETGITDKDVELALQLLDC